MRVLIESRPALDAELSALVMAQQRELREADGGVDGQVFRPDDDAAYLPAAIALYRSAGYLPIPVYGEYVGNPFSICFEKRMAVLVQ